MRLLKRKPDNCFDLISFNNDDLPAYAILSHTWTDGEEVTYDELIAGCGKDKAGYTKIRFCGERAARDGLQYFWVDTCCINKGSDPELSESINSMFRWYQHATKCYVFLSDVEAAEDVTDIQTFRTNLGPIFRQSRWFSRGWTLQELIAPLNVEFFSEQGKRLGTKLSLEEEIHEITQIPIKALRGQRMTEFSVKERMDWIAGRSTTKKEDKAYCLLGIFGIFMPLIYGEGEAHAFLRLNKQIQESSKGKEASYNTHLPSQQDKSARMNPSSNVPFRRDKDFIDRGDILACVEERCSQPAGRATLVGFGGFGKSQLAIEYAHRIRKESPDTWVFWMHASNSARFVAAFCDIGRKVGILSQPDASADKLQLVQKWLCDETSGRWLIVLDNVDIDIMIETQKGEKFSLAALLPQSENGAILITSRNADVARGLVGREQDIIPVETMSEDEAVRLMQSKLGSSEIGISELVNAVDCIPLAVIQVAAYINRLKPRMSATKYLDELKVARKQVQLLRSTAPDMRRDDQASNSVLMTWQVSFDYIQQTRPSAGDLLSFMSFFNRQGIPEFMLRYYATKGLEGQGEVSNKHPKQDEEEDEDANFEEDIAVLRSFSLVGVTQREDEFEMHGLVQLTTRIWLRSANTEKKWQRAFIKAMAQEFPLGEYENWPKCRILFPHVLPITELRGIDGEITQSWALLLDNAGWYLFLQGQFAQAEDMLAKSLNTRKMTLGAQDLRTINTFSLLATVWIDLGKHEAAEVMHRQVLAVWEKEYGREHQYTSKSMDNIATALSGQGKYKEAEAMYRQALAISEKALGNEHQDTLASIHNLVSVLAQQGKYEEAEILQRQRLAICEKVLGREHPDTLTVMNHFAYILSKQGKHEVAEVLQRQVLAAREKVLGKEHPSTLISMGNLASLLSAQDKDEEAETIHRQELAMSEKVLGQEHLNTLMSVYCLAYQLAKRHRYAEATTLYERACAGYNTNLGYDHPHARSCRANYSEMLASQRRYNTSLQ